MVSYYVYPGLNSTKDQIKEIIIDNVLHYYGVGMEDVTKESRLRKHVVVRYALCYFLNRFADMTMMQISNLTGRNDHSLVVYAIGKVKDDMDFDPQYAATIKYIENCILKFESVKHETNIDLGESILAEKNRIKEMLRNRKKVKKKSLIKVKNQVVTTITIAD